MNLCLLNIFAIVQKPIIADLNIVEFTFSKLVTRIYRFNSRTFKKSINYKINKKLLFANHMRMHRCTHNCVTSHFVTNILHLVKILKLDTCKRNIERHIRINQTPYRSYSIRCDGIIEPRKEGRKNEIKSDDTLS